ncbi:hypothetical protein GJ496_004713 [Pomphorhynchus laevis]|nr:hypothetical protein GJ496_004713 [Pomphorhynchus laevis]
MINYSDNGIFTITLCASPVDSGKAAKSVMNVFKDLANAESRNNRELEQLLASAKSKIMLKVQSEAHCPRKFTNNLAECGVHKLFFYNPEKFADEVNSTNIANIQNILQKMLSLDYGYAALGNLSYLPYRDELNQ